MKEFIYKPEERGNKTFKGEILISIPKYKERLGMIKGLNFQFNEKGEVQGGSEQFESAIKIVDIAEKHVKQLALTVIETGEKISTLDDLEYSQEGTELMNEVANFVLSGVQLGKSSKVD